MKDAEVEVNTTSFRLPSKHIIHLIGLHAMLLIAIFLVKLPFVESRIPLLILCILSPFFPIWQTNIIAPRVNKRVYHFQSRIIHSFLFPAVFFFFRYIEGWNGVSVVNYLGVAVVTLAYSGSFSLIIYHLKIKLVTSNKYYFIGKSIWSLPIIAILILSSIIIKTGWLNSSYDDIKIWSDTDPLTYDDFKGYPNIFDKYDASITSAIEYRYDADSTIESIDAVCYVGQTWVNPWSKGSSSLLRHEAYHFKITEMVARMARKAAQEAIKAGVSKDSMTVILAQHQLLKRQYQCDYDDETKHSLLSDRQSEWQYFVDSTLFELDAYWTSDILKQRKDTAPNVKYYRNINENRKQVIFGSNELMPNEERYVKHYKFVYGEDQSLKEITYYSGGEIGRDNFFKASKIRIDQSNSDTIEWRFYDQYDQATLCNDNYHKKRIVYNGKELKTSFFDKNEKLTQISNQVYYLVYKLDSKGRITTGTYLDKEGSRVANKDGVYKTKFFYANDSTALATTVKNYDIKGRPTINKNGVFEHTYSFDQEGNQTYYSEKDLEGNYLYREGYAIKYYRYDNLGRISHTSFIDEDSNLVENEHGFAIYSYSDDRYGNINRYSKYNSNGVLKGDKEDYAQIYYSYDIEKRLLSEARYDTGSKLIFDEDGYGKVKYSYDSLGRKHTITNLNAYDQPLSRDMMGAIEVRTYDTINNKLFGHYLNEKGEKDTSDLGDAAYEETYDEDDNLLEIKIFDLNGNVYAPKQNTAIYRYEYDERGNKTKASYFTAEDKPSFANQGAHINEYKYSKEGWTIERSYRDTANNLIEYDGYAKIKWKYDSLGNEIEVQYYNRLDKLIDSGTAVIKTKWTKDENVASEEEYDHEGKGILMKKFEWDEDDNITSAAFFTINGFKSLDEDAIHKYVYEYKNGVYCGDRLYDTLGKLVELDNVAYSVFELDSRGSIVAEKTYDRLGKLVIKKGEEYAIAEYERDDYDRIISEEYYDEHEAPAVMEGKYSSIRYKLDKSGNILWKGFFDSEGELTTNEEGISLYQRRYNRNNATIVAEDLKLEVAKKVIDGIDW